MTSFVAKTTTHGIVGGALNAAQGGNFLEGFASGAIGKAFGRLATGGPFGRAGDGSHAGLALRTAVAAIGGCAGAVLGGGKCCDGAVTASLAHLFNAEGLGRHPPSRTPDADDPWYKRINRQHRQGVDQAARYYESQDFEIVAREAWVGTGLGVRIYDILVRAGGNLLGIEVKTTIGNSITLNRRQVAKDLLVVRNGGLVVGGGGISPNLIGQGVNGVGYIGVCIGCNHLYANSHVLHQTLRAARIPVTNCHTGAACSVRGRP